MLDKTYNPSEIEPRLYEGWERAGAFACDPNSNATPYTIMIPPPNVTGSLHMGHALTFTVQDTLIRWRRMQGRDVLWQPGTDHAGIATQMVVERLLAEQGTDRRESGTGQVRRARLAVEGGIGRHDHPAVAPARCVAGLAARAVHHGRWAVGRGAEGVRRPVPGRADLSRPAPGELGPEAADRDLRPRGGEPRGEGVAVAHPLSDRGCARPVHHRGDDAAGDDAGRHGGGGASRG